MLIAHLSSSSLCIFLSFTCLFPPWHPWLFLVLLTSSFIFLGPPSYPFPRFLSASFFICILQPFPAFLLLSLFTSSLNLPFLYLALIFLPSLFFSPASTVLASSYLLFTFSLTSPFFPVFCP